MSLLRPSIAGRLLQSAAPAARRPILGAVRYESHSSLMKTSQGKVPTDSVNGRETSHNAPDYAAEVDQASSCVGKLELQGR